MRLFDQPDRSAAADGPPPNTKAAALNDKDRVLRERAIIFLRSANLSNAEGARRSDLSGSVFSEWINAKYRGSIQAVVDKVEKWLATEDATLINQSALIAAPAFVETSVARRIEHALNFAQSSPSMVLITLGSGLGKTTMLARFQATRTLAYRVAIEPLEGRVNNMLRKIARVIGLPDQRRISDLSNSIAERLRRVGGRQPLLMLDEAQNLSDEAVNQLRFLLDEAQCGLALAGNEDLMVRYGLSATREGYGQIHRRVGMRVHIKQPPREDVDLLLDTMAILDPEMRRIAHLIALRPGTFGQVVDTLKLASLVAYGAGRQMTADDVKSAWNNRAREELR